MFCHGSAPAVEIFVKLAELKSFSAAATALNLSRTLVSERVRDLEEDLGVRLLQRTTRRVGLTESGAAFLERVRVGLSALEEAAAEASSLSVEPRGLLRVNAALSFGFRHLAPAVGVVPRTLSKGQRGSHARRSPGRSDRRESGHRYPHWRVAKFHGHCSEAGDLPHACLCSTRLSQAIWRPKTPTRSQEPHLLQLFALAGRRGLAVRAWPRENHRARRIAPRSNNGDAFAEAAVSGAGIALQPDFIAGPLIKQGRLVEVLPGWRAAEYGVFALYPPTQFLPAKSRVFLDHLAEAFAKSPWL